MAEAVRLLALIVGAPAAAAAAVIVLGGLLAAAGVGLAQGGRLSLATLRHGALFLPRKSLLARRGSSPLYSPIPSSGSQQTEIVSAQGFQKKYNLIGIPRALLIM